ncbi:SET domain-containing protein [Trichinella spiralis]|uniref:SET domain-containing protein n=1 Tax=Trichinella spiralis TaxID=6334 RepID=A0ABR3KSD9_TRISP
MDEEEEEIVNTPPGSQLVSPGREPRVRKVNQRVQEFMRSYLIPSVRHSEKEVLVSPPKIIIPRRVMRSEVSGKYLPSVIASRENWLRVEDGVAFCMACQCILRIRKFSIKWGDKLPQSDVAKLLRHEKGVNHEKALKKYMNVLEMTGAVGAFPCTEAGCGKVFELFDALELHQSVVHKPKNEDSVPSATIRYAENSDYSWGSDDSFERNFSTDAKSGKAKKKSIQNRFMKRKRVRILKRRVRLIGHQKPIIVRSLSFAGKKRRLPYRVRKQRMQCVCRCRRLSKRLIQCDSCHLFQHPGCVGIDCSSPIKSYLCYVCKKRKLEEEAMKEALLKPIKKSWFRIALEMDDQLLKTGKIDLFELEKPSAEILELQKLARESRELQSTLLNWLDKYTELKQAIVTQHEMAEKYKIALLSRLDEQMLLSLSDVLKRTSEMYQQLDLNEGNPMASVTDMQRLLNLLKHSIFIYSKCIVFHLKIVRIDRLVKQLY